MSAPSEPSSQQLPVHVIQSFNALPSYMTEGGIIAQLFVEKEVILRLSCYHEGLLHPLGQDRVSCLSIRTRYDPFDTAPKIRPICRFYTSRSGPNFEQEEFIPMEPFILDLVTIGRDCIDPYSTMMQRNAYAPAILVSQNGVSWEIHSGLDMMESCPWNVERYLKQCVQTAGSLGGLFSLQNVTVPPQIAGISFRPSYWNFKWVQDSANDQTGEDETPRNAG